MSTQEDRGIGEDLKLYIENKVQLLLIRLTDDISFLLANTIQRIVGILFVFCGVLFAWLALAFYLSELLQSNSLGFLVAAIPPLIAGFFIGKYRSKKLSKKIQAMMIKKLLDEIESNPSDDESNAHTDIDNNKTVEK